MINEGHYVRVKERSASVSCRVWLSRVQDHVMCSILAILYDQTKVMNVGHASKDKEFTTVYNFNQLCIVTYTVLLAGDTAPQHSFIRKARKDHPQRQGGQTGPLGSLWHGTW